MLTISKIISILAVLLLLPQPSDGFISWLFRGNRDDIDDLDFSSDQKVPVPQTEVPFEMAITDEKFLEKQHMIKDLSPLDTCQHLVISEIKATCTSLTEEQIAKLAVRLLNCQSEIEDRKTYPCTTDMAIADCTREMDGTTWNAYQIVSNRARAICFSTRQQQFRLRTEHTVNRLVHTTQDQIQAMTLIKEGQEKVNEVTSTTLKKMEDSQVDLLERQGALKSAQMNIHTYIASNLRELTREKSLIATGNKELAEMTESIQQKLDNATKRLEEQEENRKENHQDILDDLAAIREKAREVWAKIDETTTSVLSYHQDTAHHYSETIQNLERVNATITHVLATIGELEKSVSEKLGWISTYLGGTGDRFALLSTVVLHVLYFLEAAVTMSILRTPHFSRVILLMVVPLNAWSEVRHKTSLNLTGMTLLLMLTIALNWFGEWLYQKYYSRRRKTLETPRSSVSGMSGADSPDLMLVPCSSPLTPLVPNGSSNGVGLNSPDIRKLVVILETLCKQGILSPAVPVVSEDPVSSTQNNTDSEEPASDSHETPIDTSLPHNSSMLDRDVTDSAKARVDLVRRRLLSSPMAASPLAGTSRQRGSRQTTPSHSRQGTPLRNTPSNRSSRASTPSRPLCRGRTVLGTACKNACRDNSDFCYRHEYQESDSD